MLIKYVIKLFDKLVLSVLNTNVYAHFKNNSTAKIKYLSKLSKSNGFYFIF